ncbi:hypothetical protein THRCLA_01010 [Thraustotheca clavata]|uniref:Uncharacterized protein n=1 Tax=Thraustotheca clavata TaxID=74557 RepID=A0A1W0A9K1_9STRA|nr:hypothetical protein THRCLA_01010 [Thraustotheca clavata]
MDAMKSDCRYGPATDIGAIIPFSFKPHRFARMKVEIGISRVWKLLNANALHWNVFPGVQYILSLCVSLVRSIRQYKSVVFIEGKAPVDTPPIEIINPALISIESRRLLALRDDVPIPKGFANPNVEIDLCEVEDAGTQPYLNRKNQGYEDTANHHFSTV